MRRGRRGKRTRNCFDRLMVSSRFKCILEMPYNPPKSVGAGWLHLLHLLRSSVEFGIPWLDLLYMVTKPQRHLLIEWDPLLYHASFAVQTRIPTDFCPS